MTNTPVEQPTNIEELTKAVVAAALVGNAVDHALQVISSGQGLLGKLKLAGVFMDAAPAFVMLANLNYGEFKAEANDLSDADIQAVAKSFNDTLSLSNKSMEYTIEHVIAIVSEAQGIARKGIEKVKELIAMFAPHQLQAALATK